MSAPAETPERIALDLHGRKLVFARVGAAGYAAELDGARVRLRYSERTLQVSEGGTGPTPPARDVLEAEVAPLGPLVRWAQLDGHTQRRAGEALELEACDNWGHFRQNTYFHIRVQLAGDGTLDLDMRVSEQDDSYY